MIGGSGALGLPEVREKMPGMALEPVGASAEDRCAHLRAELARWVTVIKRSGLRID